MAAWPKARHSLIALLTSGAIVLGSVPSSAITGASFLSIDPSPRSFALGMTNAISSLGVEAIGSNPANLLATSSRYSFFTSYASMLDSSMYESVAMSWRGQAPVFGPASFGVSYTRLDSGSIAGADASGNPGGSSFSASDQALTLGGATEIWNGLTAGVDIKAIHSAIAGFNSNIVPALDAGVGYRVGARGPFALAASVTNVGGRIKFLSQSDPIPNTFNLAAAAPVGPVAFVLQATRLIADQQSRLGLGVEYGIGPVAFRVGYLLQSEAGNLALQDSSTFSKIAQGGLSGGVGVRVSFLSFDYGVSQQAVDYGVTHRVALTARWGGGTGSQTSGPPHSSEDSDWVIRPMGGP